MFLHQEQIMQMKPKQTGFISFTWGGKLNRSPSYTSVSTSVYPWGTCICLCSCACISSHLVNCSKLYACLASCLRVILLMLQYYFRLVKAIICFVCSLVCRAVPVRLPYNTVWLTSQQQTAAALSQSVSYYAAFARHFSAVVGKHSRKTAVTTSKECENKTHYDVAQFPEENKYAPVQY